jgi:2,5-diamino-6-(ribosylamino)-4(3H)-pyrimidinone 5'-phosphate reductase
MAKLRDALTFPASQSQQIDPYLPQSSAKRKPSITLTFATSLDSQLSLAPGVQTALSGSESKAMTHYLRSKHDAILIGVGTAIADNPSLNCRIEGVGGYGGEGLEGQPRPIVLDPSGRWNFTADSKVMKLAKEGRGKAPWLITRDARFDEGKKTVLESVGGKVFNLSSSSAASSASVSSMSWPEILDVLGSYGVKSIMVEGGGFVINDLLSPENFKLVDSVIITIAPTWLGKGGVQVCPDGREENGTRLPVGRLGDVKWLPLGEDVVLCGYPRVEQ